MLSGRVYNLLNIMSKQITFPRGAQWRYFVLIVGCLFLLIACSGEDEAPDVLPAVPEQTSETAEVPESESAAEPADSAAAETSTVAPTAEPLPTATVTTEPLAALVNDIPITLNEYERELARYEQAQLGLGGTDGGNYQQVVLDTLIEQTLIEQTAAEQGITITNEMVDEKIAESVELVGGNENFQSWLTANQYTEEEFREILATQMLTAEVVSVITADVPTAVEQVRARYLQVDSEALAQQILAELAAGSEFATQAQLHSLDRITGENGGDLGFFARGSLLIPELEEAAFGLEAGQTSEIIPLVNQNGQTLYYIVQLIERDPARPLQENQRSLLLQEWFEAWLSARKNEANIVVYLEG